jgi:hypothetical protein
VTLLAAPILGCASRPLLLLHAEIAFPEPEGQTCAGGGRPYRLTLSVRDESGGAFANASVFLFPVTQGAEAGVALRTNESGVAVAEAATAGVYSIQVATVGFEPQVRALSMRPGCSGSTAFVLKLGPTIVEQ